MAKCACVDMPVHHASPKHEMDIHAEVAVLATH